MRKAAVLAGSAVAAGAVLVAFLWRGGGAHGRIQLSSPVLAHDQFLTVAVSASHPRLASRWETMPPRARVLRGTSQVPGLRGEGSFPLSPVRDEDGFVEWRGSWPVPWGLPDGAYSVVIEGAEGFRVPPAPFETVSRAPLPLPGRLVALTLDEVGPLEGLSVMTPEGTQGGWRGLLDWADLMGADSFWAASSFPEPGLASLSKLGEETRRRGLTFGVWIRAFRMPEEPAARAAYRPALDLEGGIIVETDWISLGDPRRVDEVAEHLRLMRDLPSVDLVGLESLGGPGGYELADEFFSEAGGLPLPSGWEKLSTEGRAAFLARRLEFESPLGEVWRWWKARRTARVLRRVRSEIGPSRPLWVFTQGADLGRGIGQDPSMLGDAGADLLAVALPPPGPEFDRAIRDWGAFLPAGGPRVVAGDFLGGDLDPGEIGRRLKTATDFLCQGGRPCGLFAHDLSRALWARPPRTRDWIGAVRLAGAEIPSGWLLQRGTR